MAYTDFTLSGITKQFGLSISENLPLFEDIAPVSLDPSFVERLSEDAAMALSISTEKARSEFIIAPILSEMRRMGGRRIGLFSGVDFPADPTRGLVGVCDYIVTRSPEQLFVTAPILMLVEAKNEDMKRGYAQCIAEMLGAQAFNQREGVPTGDLYGIVTIGNIWRFLHLRENAVAIDRREYYLENVAEIIAVLLYLTRPE